jgi:pimeloyl-ACP methyl ester carboxylesterase
MADQAKAHVDGRDLFVDAGGVRLAVRDYGGEGRPLILLHGGPGPNLAVWDRFAPRLVGRLRVFAFDQRGHGQSDDAQDYSYPTLVGDIRAVVHRLGLDEPILVGHSWGGMIALLYAADYPECPGVVAVDGILPEEWRGHSDERWGWLEDELRANPVVRRTLGFVGTSAQLDDLLGWVRTVGRSHYPDFSEATFRRDLRVGTDGLLRSRHSLDSIVALHRAVAGHRMPGVEVYGRITCPVMLVMATRGMFGRDTVARTRARHPALRVEWLDSGHAIQEERPNELAALVGNFVRGIPREA